MNSRRSFIKRGVAAISVPIVIPDTHIFSVFNSVPSDSVNVGVIGTGDRGQGLMKILNRIEKLNLVAICDTLPFRLEAATSISPKAITTGILNKLI